MVVVGGATLAVIAVLAAAGSAYAAYSASEAQARAIDYQKKQARINAKQARDAAEAAADIAHERHQRILAAQRAALGASGVTTTEGSSLIVQMDAAEQAALEEGRIRAAGQTAATGLENQAKLFGYQARATRRAGYIAAGTSLLGGTARAYGAYAGAGSSTGSTSPGYGGASTGGAAP